MLEAWSTSIFNLEKIEADEILWNDKHEKPQNHGKFANRFLQMKTCHTALAIPGRK